MQQPAVGYSRIVTYTRDGRRVVAQEVIRTAAGAQFTRPFRMRRAALIRTGFLRPCGRPEHLRASWHRGAECEVQP